MTTSTPATKILAIGTINPGVGGCFDGVVTSTAGVRGLSLANAI
jgi:hypothetical protein